MNTIEFLKSGLEGSYGWASGLIKDMEDAPLTFPTSNGGNHPLWILGHLVYSESFLFDQAIMGRDNRCGEWAELFGTKSVPVADAGKYPRMGEVFSKWEEIRSEAVAYLDTLTPDDLDKKSHAPEEYGPMFATVGGCYSAMINHAYMHSGQVTDARRAARRDPLFM